VNSHRDKKTLRGELTRLATLVGFGWVLAMSIAVSLAVKYQVDDLMDETLRESAEVIYGLLVAGRVGEPSRGELPEVLPAPRHEEHLVWQIVDRDGRVVHHSHRAPREALSTLARRGFFDVDRTWRVFGMRMPDASHVLYVAQIGSERLESRYTAAGFVVMVATAVSAGWILLLRRRIDAALRPLQDLAQKIETYDPVQADGRLDAGVRAETAVIADAVNALGQRLLRRIETERAFAACATHSLRTPLAGMDAQLALAQRQQGDIVPYRLGLVRAAVERLTQVIQSLLALFRAGDSANLELEPVSLVDLLARMPVQGLHLVIDADLTFTADPNLLTVALANLLDNSSRLGAREVRFAARACDGMICLSVTDDGPGMAPERRLEILKSLDDGGFGPNVGLGLRLASLVARVHRGFLRLPEQAGRTGFQVDLMLGRLGEAPAHPE
jgi:two-component system OmpR family sensor kinase